MLDEQTAWYEADDRETFAPVALYRTNDGGRSWSRFPWTNPALIINGLSIVDSHYAWVSAEDASTDPATPHLFLFGGSTQGGVEAHTPGQSVPGFIYFNSSQVGWALVPVAVPERDSFTWALFNTRDGAQTWTQQALPLPDGVSADALVSILFLGFGDAQEGYLDVSFDDAVTGSQSSHIYRTLDGGQSWSPYRDPEPVVASFFIAQIDEWHLTASLFVHFVDPQTLGTLQRGH